MIQTHPWEFIRSRINGRKFWIISCFITSWRMTWRIPHSYPIHIRASFRISYQILPTKMYGKVRTSWLNPSRLVATWVQWSLWNGSPYLTFRNVSSPFLNTLAPSLRTHCVWCSNDESTYVSFVTAPSRGRNSMFYICKCCSNHCFVRFVPSRVIWGNLVWWLLGQWIEYREKISVVSKYWFQ